jgi:uncharacterized protein YoxC
MTPTKSWILTIALLVVAGAAIFLALFLGGFL